MYIHVYIYISAKESYLKGCVMCILYRQGVLVAILVGTGVIKADPNSKLFPDEKDIGNAIQVCI